MTELLPLGTLVMLTGAPPLFEFILGGFNGVTTEVTGHTGAPCSECGRPLHVVDLHGNGTIVCRRHLIPLTPPPGTQVIDADVEVGVSV